MVATALLVLAALAGCSAPAAQTKESGKGGPVLLASRPQIGGTPARLDSTLGQALPLAEYQLRPEARLAVSKAERMLTAKCMARYGFSDPNAWLPEPQPDRDPLERRYGLADATMAEQWGYHVPPGWKGQVDDLTRQNRPVLSQSELLVLSGRGPQAGPTSSGGLSYQGTPVPEGGCQGEAKRRISPDGDFDDPELVRRIDGSPQSDSDPVVLQVFADWSACMKGKGFDRTKPVKDPKAPKLAPEPNRAEIEQATADVACKRQTNLVGVWFAAESAYQDAMIQQNITALAEIRQQNDRTVKAATEIVATG
ncbi:hypothetical protein ASC99_18905 [Kitasatospora sp. Root107]|nr:hypothetical protein ASC99_18905 [Kitasatospora sp. Root107]